MNFVILTNTSSPSWQRSIGAYQVAHHCRANGITCQVIDFTDQFSTEELETQLNKFIDSKTVAIGISTTFYVSDDGKKKFMSTGRQFDTVIPHNIRDILERVKLVNPKLKIVAGGANSYQIKDDSLFDAVFHGYSEQSVVDYLHSLTNGKKRIWPTQGTTAIIDGAKDHFDIETLDHSWTNQDCVLAKETLPIEISRGCIFKCKFCSYPLNGKKKFDYLRDPQRIREELIRNYKLYQTTNYYFTDDTLNDSTFKLQRLHEVITSLPFKIKFVCYLRLDLLYAHPEQIKLLYEMGLGSAFFGIETLNASSGKAIGKGMNPENIKPFINELHDIHWKKEISIMCSFIIGLPGETVESVKSTYEWLKTTSINDVWFPLFIKSNGHFKSEFDVNFLKYGYKIDSNNNWYNDQMDYNTALKLAEQFNNEGIHRSRKPTAWHLFSLLSYGYEVSDLKDITIDELPKLAFMRKKKKMFQEYKTLLSAISNDD